MLVMCLFSKGPLFRPWGLTNRPCGPLSTSTYTYTYTFACMYTHTHTYTCTHIYTYTHTHKLSQCFCQRPEDGSRPRGTPSETACVVLFILEVLRLCLWAQIRSRIRKAIFRPPGCPRKVSQRLSAFVADVFVAFSCYAFVLHFRASVRIRATFSCGCTQSCYVFVLSLRATPSCYLFVLRFRATLSTCNIIPDKSFFTKSISNQKYKINACMYIYIYIHIHKYIYIYI